VNFLIRACAALFCWAAAVLFGLAAANSIDVKPDPLVGLLMAMSVICTGAAMFVRPEKGDNDEGE